MRIIDSHQYFWRYSAEKYPWIKENMKALMRDYMPEDVASELGSNHIDGCVAVQARPSLKEARWLLDLASQERGILGVVVWIDLTDDELERTLDDLASLGKLKGVRHVSQASDGKGDFLRQKAFARGLKMVEQKKLAVDLMLPPEQLATVSEVLEKAPSLSVVLNDMASPPIGRDNLISTWQESLKPIAQHSNLFCKWSGFITKVPWHNWRFNDFIPTFDALLKTFGPKKLLFGSDWPMLLLGTRDYADVLEILDDYLDELPTEDLRSIYEANATKVYNL